jgi:hypothetical protein
MSQYVAVRDLPTAVQSALESVRYGSADIRVVAAEKVYLGDAGAGDGVRAFTVLVDLDKGAHHTIMGSWGGQNMFDRTNPVDNDRNEYALPGNGAAITGSLGGGRPTYATLHIPASMTARILPTASETLPQDELDFLACYKGYTSAYRKELFARRPESGAVIDRLVDKGLVKRNKAGATQITTAGKNAAGDHRVAYNF